MKVPFLLVVLLTSSVCLAQPVLDSKTSIFPSSVVIEHPTKKQQENLVRLCKIWGYAKYKHPEIVGDSIDWDRELLKFLQLYKSEDFDDELYHLLPKLEQKVSVDSLYLIEYPLMNDTMLSEHLKSYMQHLALLSVQGHQNYIEPGKWNITPHFKENEYPLASWNDDGLRLLTLFRYWNIIEYFHPYKTIIGTDWEFILEEYITKILEARTELEYKLCILELIAEINDGHAGIHGDEMLTNYFGKNQLPIQVKLIEGKVYVIDVFDEFENDLNIRAGDILLKVNDHPTDSMLLSNRKYISASTKASKNRQLSELILRTNASIAKITVERNGSLVIIKAPTIEYNPIRYVQQNIEPYRDITKDISYIYPGSLANEKVDSILELARNKKAIILDYRSYPLANLQAKLPNFLLPYPRYAFQSNHYNLNPLGEFYMTEPYKWGAINNDYYKGKLIILVNEYTQSQSEFETLIYRQGPNTIVIGSSTAGAVGNWTPIQLPLKMLTSMSGNGIYGLNDQQVQRVGIIPDIYIEQSLEGIVNGKDEILTKAIEYCNEL